MTNGQYEFCTFKKNSKQASLLTVSCNPIDKHSI